MNGNGIFLFSFVVSLDENIIDFESRKVKEKRAQDEVLTGKYRHPNFITSKLLFNMFQACGIFNYLYYGIFLCLLRNRNGKFNINFMYISR